MLRLKNLFALLFFLSCLSCTPRFTQVYLNPEGLELTDENHREIVQLQEDDLFVNCDFLQASMYDLIFELQIINQSDRTVEVDPVEFYYMAVDQGHRMIAREHAYDPDNLVFELDETIRNDRKAAKSQKTAGWVLFGLDVLATAVSIANNDDYAPLYAINTGAHLIENQVANSTIEKHIVYLEDERDYYESRAIRPAILEPGESLDGIVIFPRIDHAHKFYFQFEMDDKSFNITYRQRRL